MPELPEVETTRRGIEPHIVGRQVQKLVVRQSRLRWPVPQGLAAQLENHLIQGISRRAKYLLLYNVRGTLIIHLGMSGSLCLLDRTTPPGPHDHIDLVLSGGRYLRFNDPRRFGAILLADAGAAEHTLLSVLGPEPFDEQFNTDYLHARSRGRKSAVKNFIMDGSIVVGAGNIYASEALFRAGIRPTRQAGKLSRTQCALLCVQIRNVLSEAIAQGGTTLRDFVGVQGQAGYFQQDLYVYGRESLPCRICSSPIQRKIIGQRSSFFCPTCQR